MELNRQRKAGMITNEAYSAQVKALTAQTQQLTVVQKESTVASKAMGIALNMIANVAIMAAISLIITGITKLVNKQKELKENIDNVIQSFDTLKSKTDDLVSNSNKLIPEFEKIADGVNSLGENVSLTSEEFDKYHDITNQIAEDIPSIIQGYDNEGNVIINLKDNVNDLKQAYIDARKEKYNLALADDSIDDAIKYYKSLSNPSWYNRAFDLGQPSVGGVISNDEAIADLTTILSKNYDEVIETLKNASLNNEKDELSVFGEGYLSTLGLNVNTTETEFENIRNNLKAELQTLQSDANNSLLAIKNIATAYMFTNDDYDKLDSNMQSFASIIINGMTKNVADGFESKADIGGYVVSVIENLRTNEAEIQNAYSDLLKINTDDLSITDAKQKIDSYIQTISDYLGIDANQLKITLGFTKTDDMKSELDRVVNKAKEKFNLELNWLPTIEEDYGVNTKEEIAILSDCINKASTMTEALELYKSITEQTKLENKRMVTSLENLKTAYEELSKSTSTYTKNQKSVTDALEEQKEQGQLSYDTIQSLTEAGYAQALVIDEETGKVTLNEQAYNRLNQQKLEELKLTALEQKTDLQKHFNNEQIALNNLSEEMRMANDERRKAIVLEMQQHGLVMSDISEQMAGVDALMASFNAPEPPKSNGSSKSSDPKSVTDFEKALADYQHEINMGRKEEDEAYYTWLENAAHTAYDGLADYQDDLYKYEEEVYKGRKKLAEDYYNEQKELFEDHINNLENNITLAGEDNINDKGNKLDNPQKYDYIRSVYKQMQDDTQSRIDEIKKFGIEGHEDELKQLEKQWREYGKEIVKTFDDEVQSEIDFLKDVQDKKIKALQEQIDLEKEKKELVEDTYDVEIEKIQDQIDLIKNKTDEKDRALKIQEAEFNLEKAKSNRKLTYGATGEQIYASDKEEIANAQKALEDALKEEQTAKLEEQVKLLENQKDIATKGFDNTIDLLEKQKDDEDKKFSILIDLLDEYLKPQNQTTSNADIWKRIANNENIKYQDGKYIDKNGNIIDINKLVGNTEKPNTAATDNTDIILQSFGLNKDTWINGLEKLRKDYMPISTGVTSEAISKFGSIINKQQPVSVNIGDIVVNNPISDSIELAKDIVSQLPNSIMQQMYKK